MKKILTVILFACMIPFTMQAQNTMTDDQVIQFIVKEHDSGTSQAQIVTKLMQRGVDIQQIQRVRRKYERQIQEKGLGVVADEAVSKTAARMRSKNGKEKEDDKTKDDNNLRIQNDKNYHHSYDEDDQEFMDMQEAMTGLLAEDLEKDSESKKSKSRIYGHDIFNNKNLTFEPNMNIATPQNYRLGPGDQLFIDIYGASQQTFTETVSPDGEVTIEGYGPIQLSGLTVAQANARLRSTLGTRYSSSKIKLTVGQTKTIMVNVMGEVKAPGTYTLSAFASVFHALYMAGGVNDLGTLRDIKVYRNGKLLSSVDIYDYIQNGKLTGNIRLSDGDVIQVDTYDCLVTVEGKVKRPMIYEMRKNESINSLLKYSGGFTGDAYTKAVRVERKNGRDVSIYNVEEFDMGSFHVADGDLVSVDSILNRFHNTVEIKGAVFRPGKYQCGGSVNSVRSLIERAEGVTEGAFTTRAVMHRMKADRTLEVVSVDVAGILNGTVADIALKENDILYIPTKQDVQLERTITIHGEVNYPGTYQYADNETLEDFILQAGGLTESASVVKVDVARRIVDPKATTTAEHISETFQFALKDGFVIDGEQGFTLKPYDEVYVRKSPGYSVQQNVHVQGHVNFAGTYALSTKNERLSDIIKASGGVTDMAYVPGARLERRITPEERLRMENVIKAAYRSSNGNDSIDMKKLDLGDTYYVGIELDKALAHPGGDADIILRAGDRIIVPEYNNSVKISGDVMYPNTVAFEKGKRPKYYIEKAGGFGSRAKKSHTYIIYMNGTVARVGHNAKILPGCEIVVPSKPKNNRSLGETLAIGTSAASIATMVASVANLFKN